MSISATNLAHQGIQAGFKQLADNTAQLNPNNNNKPTPSPESLKEEGAPVQNLEEMLLNNNKTQTQIESLAKVIKTEDELIGKLFEDWA